MIKKMFSKEYLIKELGLPYNYKYVREDSIEYLSRWSVHHELVFKDKDGQCWSTEYRCGATELQDEQPWEYEDKVECIKVEKRFILRKEWLPVEDNNER